MNGSKKRPRVEKISSSRYRAYQGMWELIQGMRELIQAAVAHVNAIATRSLFTAGSFFGTATMDVHLLGVRMNRSTFSRSNIAELRASQMLLEDGDLEAVVSQANRKQLRWALRFESPLNGRPSMVR